MLSLSQHIDAKQKHKHIEGDSRKKKHKEIWQVKHKNCRKQCQTKIYPIHAL